MRLARAVGNEIAAPQDKRRAVNFNAQCAFEDKSVFIAIVGNRLIGIPGIGLVFVDRDRHTAGTVFADDPPDDVVSGFDDLLFGNPHDHAGVGRRSGSYQVRHRHAQAVGNSRGLRYAYEDGRLRRDYTLEFPFIVHDRKNVCNVGGGRSWSDGENSSVGDVTLLSFIASPVEAGTTKIYVFTGRNHSLDVDDSQFTAGFDAIMEQDRVIVENQRPEQIPLAIKEELHLGFPDSASVAYRRLLRGLEGYDTFLPELA